MKQIQIKEYQKKPVSKAKSLTNLKSIYSGFKLFHQKQQHSEIKPKKRKLTRIEQLNLTDEERRLIYDRRSSSYKIRKQRQQSTSSYLTDRKLIRFLLPFSMSLEKKGERSNELYLYNYNNTTKREYMSNEQKYASVVVNTNKLFRDSDIQPDYAERKRPIMHIASQQDRYKNINSTTKNQSSIQTETKKPQQGEGRSNVSAYKPYVYQEYKYRILTREEALAEVAKAINAGKAWFDFIGQKETIEWARQRIEEWTTQGMVER